VPRRNGKWVVARDAAAAVVVAAPAEAAGGILSAVANNVLQVDASASGSVSGFVFGTEE
jgi:hypothetical protein